VSDIVRELPARVPYVTALKILRDAKGILLFGSTEPHYTASKIFPALIADRPLLAAFHGESSVVDILRRAGGEPEIRLVTYGDAGPQHDAIECMARHLAAMIRQPRAAAHLNLSAIHDVSAPQLAGRLCGVLDRICES
jgi:hypothetical protein